METIGKLVVSILGGLISSMYRAFIMLCMINWFIPSLSNVVSLNIPIMMGISSLWSLFTYSTLQTKHLYNQELKKDKSKEEKFGEFIAYNLLIPSVVLGVTFIIKQFI